MASSVPAVFEHSQDCVQFRSNLVRVDINANRLAAEQIDFEQVDVFVDDTQAPHISVIIFMRGMLTHAYTRLYFSDEAAANARDPVLLTVPEERRGTLIAQRDNSSPTPHYRFDIHMQGDDETVFFDV